MKKRPTPIVTKPLDEKKLEAASAATEGLRKRALAELQKHRQIVKQKKTKKLLQMAKQQQIPVLKLKLSKVDSDDFLGNVEI